MKFSQAESIAPGSRTLNLRPASLDTGAATARVGECSPKPRTGYSQFDLFQWLSPQAQEAFTHASRLRQIPDGSRIYSQAEPGNEMYRIVRGSVRLSVLRSDGREALYQVLQPGDCFGATSLLDGAPRCHTTNANGEVELQLLRRDAYERLRSQHPSFSDGLVRLISRHVRLLSEYLASYTLDDLPCRVAQRLLKAPKSSVIRADGIRPTVHLSQGELALMVGVSRQTVNKILKKFQSDGLICIEYGRVQILDIDGLRVRVR